MEYDNVEKPFHYNQYEHEVIELTECLGFCLGNAVKYILRAPFKGKEVEDLKKAQWYLKRIHGNGDVENEIIVDEECYPQLRELAYSFPSDIVAILIDGLTDYGMAYTPRAVLAEAIAMLDAEIEALSEEPKKEPEPKPEKKPEEAPKEAFPEPSIRAVYISWSY